jgi:hypothetical protein
MPENESVWKGILIGLMAILFILGYASFNWEYEGPCVDPPWASIEVGESFEVKVRGTTRLTQVEIFPDNIITSEGPVLFSQGNLVILEETREELPIWIGCNGGIFAEIWGHY